MGKKRAKKCPQGRNLQISKLFYNGDEKTDHILRFSIEIAQNTRLLIGRLPTLDRPFSKAFTSYPKSLKSQHDISTKSTSAKLLTSPLPERRAIVSEKVLFLFYHGVAFFVSLLFEKQRKIRKPSVRTIF